MSFWFHLGFCTTHYQHNILAVEKLKNSSITQYTNQEISNIKIIIAQIEDKLEDLKDAINKEDYS